MNYTIYSHPACLEHDPGSGHPENPERLKVITAALHKSPFANQLDYVESPLASDEQILLAHTPDHLSHIKAVSPTSGWQALDGDTVMSPESLEASLRGAGASCMAVDDLLTDKVTKAFCATRPPGHHATQDQAMGFCIFNHIAVAALYAKYHYKLDRVAIVDFDVHHGNGTQDIMTGKEGLLYISTHQSPLYPGTGSVAENIPDNIHNIPLPAGTDHHSYQIHFEQEALSTLETFKPELLLVSAGFDAHLNDPLASLALTEETYFWLGQQLNKTAQKYCQGKLLSVLEGGYNLAVLGASVSAFLQGQLQAQQKNF
ncbi:histone deacetylase family protein [Gammaproteobacteria bacterium]|nr:histone deacetylase family protein [Gammaproteobacteria bacterium]